MLAPLIVALLFLIGVIWNLVSPQGSTDNATFGMGIVGLLVWLAWYIRREESAATKEIKRLLDGAGRNSVDDHQGLSDDEVRDTKLRHYKFTFSCLLCSMTFQTRYYPAKSSERWLGWFLSMVLTLTFGWWHLPWGPVHTIRTLVHNCGGGTVQTVQEIIDEAR